MKQDDVIATEYYTEMSERLFCPTAGSDLYRHVGGRREGPDS